MGRRHGADIEQPDADLAEHRDAFGDVGGGTDQRGRAHEFIGDGGGRLAVFAREEQFLDRLGFRDESVALGQVVV